MGQGVRAGAALGYLLLGDRKEREREFKSRDGARQAATH